MNNVTETGEIEMNNIYVQIRIYTYTDTKKKNLKTENKTKNETAENGEIEIYK